MSERFETNIRAGYPEDAQGVTLGNPIRDGDVLAGVRVRLPLPTVNRPRRTAVAATPPPPSRRERSVFGTLHVSRR